NLPGTVLASPHCGTPGGYRVGRYWRKGALSDYRTRVPENPMIWMRVGFLAALAAVAQSPNASKPGPGGAKSPAQIEFVKIVPGDFMMGCVPGDTDCLEDEVPRHQVRLTNG